MHTLVHWEIPSTDLEKSKRFYAELFGWKMQGWSDDYAVFDVESGVGGGIWKLDKMPEPCVQVYIEVADIPAALARVESLGGKPVHPKIEIGKGMGFFAMFLDPCGCRIGLWSRT